MVLVSLLARIQTDENHGSIQGFIHWSYYSNFGKGKCVIQGWIRGDGLRGGVRMMNYCFGLTL